MLVPIVALMLNIAIVAGVAIYLVKIRDPRNQMSHREAEDYLECQKRKRYKMKRGTIYFPDDPSPPDSAHNSPENSRNDPSYLV